MPTPTAAERLHAQQQKNRKAAGLPDPSEYKKKLDSMKSENYEEDDGTLSQEQLDEISAQLKASYVSGAKKQIKQSMPFTKKSDEYRDIAKNFIAKREKGIARANEEVELLDEMPESNMKVRDVHSHLKKAGWELARSKGGHDVFKHPKAKHSIPVPRHALKAPLVRGILKASKVQEQLEKKGRFVSGPIKQPFKSNTIVTSVKEAADSHEYDYEGDMAKSDLRSIIFNAKQLHEMLNPDTNLAEWCQAKITLAEDYLSTVANYMRSEMNEETLDEDKNDYQRKIEKNNKNFIAASKRQKNPLTNVHTAQTKQKPVKEEVKMAEDAGDPSEGEMKAKQGYSRKAQIVRDAAGKGKKSDSSDKFQKDPELSSEIHKT